MYGVYRLVDEAARLWFWYSLKTHRRFESDYAPFKEDIQQLIKSGLILKNVCEFLISGFKSHKNSLLYFLCLVKQSGG